MQLVINETYLVIVLFHSVHGFHRQRSHLSIGDHFALKRRVRRQFQFIQKSRNAATTAAHLLQTFCLSRDHTLTLYHNEAQDTTVKSMTIQSDRSKSQVLTVSTADSLPSSVLRENFGV